MSHDDGLHTRQACSIQTHLWESIVERHVQKDLEKFSWNIKPPVREMCDGMSQDAANL